MVSHEEIVEMREHLYKHAAVLMEKIKKMFDSGELTVEQMGFAGDIMKDLSSVDKNLSKACYYDHKRGASADKTY